MVLGFVFLVATIVLWTSLGLESIECLGGYNIEGLLAIATKEQKQGGGPNYY
jgi:hypothetical protein